VKTLSLRQTRAEPLRAPVRRAAHPDPTAILYDLVGGRRLAIVVPAALELVEREPLASGGFFRGDILRGLMEVPGHFWWRSPDLLERYACALQAAVTLRLSLTAADWARFCAPITTND
jgi:hypothetical protein